MWKKRRKIDIKKIFSFLKINYFFSLFASVIIITGILFLYRIVISKPTYIYAEIKVGQGYWWANTEKPLIWMVRQIKKGDTEKDVVGSPVAKILSIKYYPSYNPSRYNIYLTLKLKVSKTKKSNKYEFKRETIAVSSPIDLEFPNIQVSGTVINLSEKPFQEKYEDKIVTIEKHSADPYEYKAIKIGDKYFDGERNVLEIIDKKETEVFPELAKLVSKNPLKKNIWVKFRLKIKKINKQFVFGEEETLLIGHYYSFATNRVFFNKYYLSKIE